MISDQSSYGGPYPTPESRGIDSGYKEVRDQAVRELDKAMAGPKRPLQEPTGVKNPDGEFAVPAAMTGSHPAGQAGPGPNQVGNSSGQGPVDPQGQQAGTEGGQPGSPPAQTSRPEGTPLAGPEERKRQSDQRRGAGVDPE